MHIRAEVETRQLNKKQKLEENGVEEKNEKNEKNEKSEEEDTLVVPFLDCLNTYFSEEIVDYKNPSLGNNSFGPASRTTKMGA